MEDIFIRLKRFFSRGNLLSKFIFINAGVFIVIRLAMVFLTLFEVNSDHLLEYVRMSSSPALLLYRPWTVITYMFLHVDLLHILFNMLWLYWFGGISLLFFSERQLGGLYVTGGIAGAILFMLAYNIFPYFRNLAGHSMLMGASASVMAIVFAVSFYRKNYEINLLLIGRVKLIYLALFTLLVDLLSITSSNAGGHIAHLGGAAFGILFAGQLKQGRDLTAFVNRGIDRLANLKKRRRRPYMKVTYRRPESDMDYNARKCKEMDALDAILEKLKRSGYDSLSADEKKRLFDASRK
ncbi:MAG: rhomboid family intramembrane serine protease [Tannerella sp.]|jgi:membrane associated rhomboid family serine protease|nr:rhomboid family intramembrane serine protease [Tannerella sp.]